MPDVSESRTTVQPVRIYNKLGSGHYYYDQNVYLPTSLSAQIGWRSRGEIEAANRDLKKVSSNAKWKDTLSVIEAMDRVERAMSSPVLRQGERPVHIRRYDHLDYTNAVLQRRTSTGAESVATFRLSPVGNPSDYLSDSDIVATGGKMIRQSRPTMPHANLGQWLGELRDSGSLLRSGMSTGQPLKVIGGGYLNWKFGWEPFVRDLIQAAEAVIDSRAIIDKFLEESGKLTRRTRKKLLKQNAVQLPKYIVSENWSNQGRNENSLRINTIAGQLDLVFRGGTGYNARRGIFELTVVAEHELRTFATFEYFAHDPEGFLGRLNSYEQKARYLLGLSLTPDIIWELTPWSWLIDWFADIGGFLSYQVSVESDSLVARQSGAVFETKIQYFGNVFSSDTSTGAYNPLVDEYANPIGFVSCTRRRQTRLPVGPYGFGSTWSLSPQQWAIMAALGLTRAPGQQKLW